MKSLSLLLVGSMFLTCCKNELTASEKRLTGGWKGMDYSSGRYSYIHFYADRTFIAGGGSSEEYGLRPVSWYADSHTIYLTYRMNSGDRSWILNIRSLFPVRDDLKIVTVNDSLLNLETKGTKRYPSQSVNMKRIKRKGKFITQ